MLNRKMKTYNLVIEYREVGLKYLGYMTKVCYCKENSMHACIKPEIEEGKYYIVKKGKTNVELKEVKFFI